MPIGGAFPFSMGGGEIVIPPVLGGGSGATVLPWVVNIVPTPDQQDSKLLKPVRFSIRDSNTFIDPVNIRVKVGYAKVFSTAEEVFDVLPRTRRVAMEPGLANLAKASFTPVRK
jgi:hypothetical protein